MKPVKPAMGIAILAIAVPLVIIQASNGNSPYPKTKKSSQSVRMNDNWRIFRGDPGLSGNIAVDLPERPEILWSFQTGGPVHSTVVAANGRVYAGSGDGKIYALSMKDGFKLWEYDTGAPVEASPLLEEKTVLAGSTNGMFFAINAENGELIWKYKTGDRIFGSANIITIDNRRYILVGSYDHWMYCLDFLTGKVRWRYETESYINGAPAILDQSVVFGGCDAKVHVISANTGKKVSEIDSGSYIAGSVAIAGQSGFLADYAGFILCIHPKSGRIGWRFGEDGGAPIVSSPAVNENRVVVGSRDRTLYCLDRKNGKKVWEYQAHGDFEGSPVICGSKIIVGGTDGRIYIIDLKNGQLLWSYEMGSPIKGCPAIAGNMIFIGSADGRIYAFGAK